MTDANEVAKPPYKAIFWATEKKLRAVLGNEDPAPWLDVDPSALSFPGEDPATYRSACKFQERTKLVLLRALLTGSLTATFVHGDETQVVPGWAWECPQRHTHIVFDGRLRLDPLLPDEWLRWSRSEFNFDQADFDAWLDTTTSLQIDRLPAQPEAFDGGKRPNNVSERLPPKQPWITLSQAISWAAFRVSLDREDLFDVLKDGSACGTQIQTRRAVADATAELLMQASGGGIKMMGKLTPFGALPLRMIGGGAVQTEEIPPHRLIDFGLFDYLSDGLSYGRGVRWHSDEAGYVRVIDPYPADCFEEVKVDRAALLIHFPARRRSLMSEIRAVLPASFPDIGLVMGLEEAICWTAFDKPSNDMDVWVNASGEMVFTDSDGANLFRGDPPPDPSERMTKYTAAHRILRRPLREGSLVAYVSPDNGSPFAIPRVYWYRNEFDILDVIYQGFEPGEKGTGSPVLLSRDKFETWRKSQAAPPDAEHPDEAAKVKRGPVTDAYPLPYSIFTDEERKVWMEGQPMATADKAHTIYKALPQYCGTKLAAFRQEWKTVKGTRQGRPRGQKSTIK